MRGLMARFSTAVGVRRPRPCGRLGRPHPCDLAVAAQFLFLRPVSATIFGKRREFVRAGARPLRLADSSSVGQGVGELCDCVGVESLERDESVCVELCEGVQNVAVETAKPAQDVDIDVGQRS